MSRHRPVSYEIPLDVFAEAMRERMVDLMGGGFFGSVGKPQRSFSAAIDSALRKRVFISQTEGMGVRAKMTLYTLKVSDLLETEALTDQDFLEVYGCGPATLKEIRERAELVRQGNSKYGMGHAFGFDTGSTS